MSVLAMPLDDTPADHSCPTEWNGAKVQNTLDGHPTSEAVNCQQLLGSFSAAALVAPLNTTDSQALAKSCSDEQPKSSAPATADATTSATADATSSATTGNEYPLDLLEWAGRENSPLVLRNLLRAVEGVELNTLSSKHGHTPLMGAASRGHFEIMNILLSHPQIQIDKSDAQGSTALMRAVRADRASSVLLLLHYGAQLDCTDDLGSTAAHFAAFHSEDSSLLRILHHFGADLTVEDSNGFTPLHMAVLANNYDACRYLTGPPLYCSPFTKGKGNEAVPAMSAYDALEWTHNTSKVFNELFDRTKRSSASYFKEAHRKFRKREAYRLSSICIVLTVLEMWILLIRPELLSLPHISPRSNECQWTRNATTVCDMCLTAVVLMFLGLLIMNPGYVKTRQRPKSALEDVQCILAEKGKTDDDIRTMLGFTDICTTCGVVRPPDTVHCWLCRRCVSGYDHHCLWLGGCIGAATLPFFCVWTTLSSFTAAFLILVSGSLFFSETDFWTTHHVCVYLLFILVLVLLLASAILVGLLANRSWRNLLNRSNKNT